MKNMTEESAGKPLSNTVSGTPETENHLDTVAELANSAVRSARNIGECILSHIRYSIKYVGTDVNRIMADTKPPSSTATDKGKMIAYEHVYTKNGRVYQKWTARNITTREPTHFCCILLDKQGNAIQANMDPKDTEYFDQLLQLNNAYRISRFLCTSAKKWQQTIDNKTTLLFGKYTTFQPIYADSFPEHYFKFIAYNEVAERANVNDASRTDYIGCIHQISGLITTGDATRSRRTRRIIDIQNLDGMNLPFVIWNEEAEKFDMEVYAQLPKPVVIAVSSTWANRRYGSLQLTATPATYYAEFINPIATLEIQRQPCGDESQESMRNRYCFRAVIDDGTGTATLTCFSPEAHTFVPECHTLIAGDPNQSSYEIPDTLREVQNKAYLFQYYFGKGARPGYPAFVLDAVFKATIQPPLPLPAPDLTTPPPPEIVHQASSATTPAESKDESSSLEQATTHETQSKSEGKTTKAKRQLFEDTQSAGNPEIIFKTHPNINKDLFSNENILGSKYPNRPFLASQLRMQSKDASAVPLTSKVLYVYVSMLDDGLILIEVARWADRLDWVDPIGET
ncbi:nucleic acid-binding, OB-fold protein [Tanacetum coccineum]